MKFLLVNIHRWVGLPLGLLFVVTFFSGSLTALSELLKSNAVIESSMSAPFHAPSIAEQATALEFISTQHGDIKQITLPTESEPFYRVNLGRETHLYGSNELEPLGKYDDANNSFFQWMLNLHKHYLLGKEGLWGVSGSIIVTWVGLASLAISLLGLYLWWPLRKKFSLKNTLPRGLKRKYFYTSHMTAGVIVLVAILLLSITGASISYRNIAQAWLGVTPEITQQKNNMQLKNKQDTSWLSFLNSVYEQMPNAQLVYIRFPREPGAGARPAAGFDIGENRGGANRGSAEGEPNASANLTPRIDTNVERPRERVNAKQGATENRMPNRPTNSALEFRFLSEGDWLGLPANKVLIDRKQGVITHVTHASAMTFGQKLYGVLMPLHTGRGLPWGYVMALLVLSLIGSLMVVSGIVSLVVRYLPFKLNNVFEKNPQQKNQSASADADLAT